MVNVSVEQLADTITDAVREYTEDVSKAVEEKVDEVADKVLQEAISLSPKRTGSYAKGFKKTKADEKGKAKRIIWNKKHYRLVHLLEFGHAKRGGGRVPAYPHLRPAYEKYAADLPGEIKRIVKKGG